MSRTYNARDAFASRDVFLVALYRDNAPGIPAATLAWDSNAGRSISVASFLSPHDGAGALYAAERMRCPAQW